MSLSGLEMMTKSNQTTLHPIQQKVFDTFQPGQLCPKIFIAGGAAVDPELATDVDLWFPKNSTEAAKQYFDALPYPKKLAEAVEISTDYLTATKSKLYGEYFLPSIGKFVQVLVTRWTSEDLLIFFDISTHMVAVHSDGTRKIFQGVTTEPNQPPNIVSYQNTTLKRYLKICARYGHKPNIKMLEPYFNVHWADNSYAFKYELPPEA